MKKRFHSCLNLHQGHVQLRHVLMLAGAVLALSQFFFLYLLSSFQDEGNYAECPMPPPFSSGVVPFQTPVPPRMAPFVLQNATLKPLAGFSLEARVLLRENYWMDPAAKLSPTDLALGWGRMSEPQVLNSLKMSQSSRWLHRRWTKQPPIPPQEIRNSSANMHMIPANKAAAKALAGVRKDDWVRIDGWLVEARLNDGAMPWRSSLSREDTGNGACEIVYVCAIRKQ